MTLYSLLETTARKAPESPAVICQDMQMTYADFKGRVDRLAAGLSRIGIGKGDRLAIIHKNCHRFLESYFAAARLGAILVPVNYRLAPGDFAYILKDSDAKGLIVQSEFMASVLAGLADDKGALEFVVSTGNMGNYRGQWEIRDYEELIEGTDLSTSDGRLEANSVKETTEHGDAAQIYYTSGTTGRPKGVILTHKNNMAHAEGTIAELGLEPNDRWLHVSPMFHLADSWAVWAITRAGGVHIMLPEFEKIAVLRAIQKHGASLSNFIPTMINILVNFEGARDYDLSSMRLVLSGGAPIAKETVRKVVDIFKCEYIQTYGLTETSPFLTMSILEDWMKELPFEERLEYMTKTGRPVFNVDVRVVGDFGKDVARNGKEVGEIIARGDTITPGYWKLPEVTSKKLANGWLRTGDMAVVDAERYLTIVDRKDDMIITGGENVYSIEVENALYSHPGIFEAAVFGLPDPVWGECVAAVVVQKDGKAIGEEELIEFCKGKLARFKAPKKVFFTRELPKTGSAKIYKYRLREIYTVAQGEKPKRRK